MKNIKFTEFLLKFEKYTKYFTEENKNKISDLDSYIKELPLKVFIYINENKHNNYIYIGKKNDEYYFYKLKDKFDFYSGKIINVNTINDYNLIGYIM